MSFFQKRKKNTSIIFHSENFVLQNIETKTNCFNF